MPLFTKKITSFLLLQAYCLVFGTRGHGSERWVSWCLVLGVSAWAGGPRPASLFTDLASLGIKCQYGAPSLSWPAAEK